MKMKDVSPLGSSFDEHLEGELRDPESAALYIASVLEDNDPAYLKVALGRVVRAHGVTKVSNLSGVGREAIYKMLSEDGNPALSSIQMILKACGLAFRVTPEDALEDSSPEDVLDLEKRVPTKDRAGVVSKLWAYIKRNNLEREVASTIGEKKLLKLAKETHQMTAGRKTTAKQTTRRKAVRKG